MRVVRKKKKSRSVRMFQKHSIMSLKKKSKSLGHLTALGSYPCSPDVEPKVRQSYDPVWSGVSPESSVLKPLNYLQTLSTVSCLAVSAGTTLLSRV